MGKKSKSKKAGDAPSQSPIAPASEMPRIDLGCSVCHKYGRALFRCLRCDGPGCFCSKACFRKAWSQEGMACHKELCGGVLRVKAELELEMERGNPTTEIDDMVRAALQLSADDGFIGALLAARLHGLAAIILCSDPTLSINGEFRFSGRLPKPA